MKGYAPGWQIRCPKCGHVQDAGEAGMTRIAAASRGKRTLMRCQKCERLRMLIVERKPEPADAAPTVAKTADDAARPGEPSDK